MFNGQSSKSYLSYKREWMRTRQKMGRGCETLYKHINCTLPPYFYKLKSYFWSTKKVITPWDTIILFTKPPCFCSVVEQSRESHDKPQNKMAMDEARSYLQKWNACSGLHGLQGLVGVGLKLRGVRLKVKSSFVNVHEELYFLGCRFSRSELTCMQNIHVRACINHSAASMHGRWRIFRQGLRREEGVTTTMNHFTQY